MRSWITIPDITINELDDLLDIEINELRRVIQEHNFDSHYCILRTSLESDVDLSDLAAMDLSCKICGYEIVMSQNTIFNESILHTFSRILTLQDEHW